MRTMKTIVGTSKSQGDTVWETKDDCKTVIVTSPTLNGSVTTIDVYDGQSLYNSTYVSVEMAHTGAPITKITTKGIGIENAQKLLNIAVGFLRDIREGVLQDSDWSEIDELISNWIQEET